jgi:ESCRT-II complex subunit VPS25
MLKKYGIARDGEYTAGQDTTVGSTEGEEDSARCTTKDRNKDIFASVALQRFHKMAVPSDFVFPAFHSFPPSYTRQPVQATRGKQAQLWCDLIRDYCRARRIFWLDISGAHADRLFRNDAINRRLSSDDIRYFLGQLVDRGDAEWGSDHSRCLVFWRRPGEWGELIFQWVQASAQGGQVLTVHEIRDSAAAKDQGTSWARCLTL